MIAGKGKSVFHFRIQDCCFSGDILSEILKIGIPTLVFQLLTSLSMSMINGAAIEYGPSALAAMGPVTKIMSQFTRNDMEMICVGQAALRASGLTFVLFGFYTVYSFLFLVMGKAKEGCFLGACRQGICFVPVILLLPGLMGLNGVFCAQPAADLLSAIVTVFLAVRLHRQLAEAGLKTAAVNL